ncbi:MAG: urease accessory protein UreD [Cyanothece sp. SIO2G6]|nr:urease accessory protein UreD [Cyanothece sp. SIO2G6]
MVWIVAPVEVRRSHRYGFSSGPQKQHSLVKIKCSAIEERTVKSIKNRSASKSTAWQGELALEYASEQLAAQSGDRIQPGQSNKTSLVYRYAKAPLKVQRPFYPEGPSVCHSVIVHTAGGMVGGDRLHLSLTAQPHARALVTTTAASKAYGKTNAVAEQAVVIKVGQGACLEWLPQELILFDGARYRQHLRVDLDPDAVWLGWEITRLGRTLRGERFTQGEWRSHLEVWQQGRPLWIDPQGIGGGGAMMTSGHGLNSCPVIATLALVGRDVPPAVMAQVRACWDQCNLPRESKVDSYGRMVSQCIHPVASQAGVSRLQSGIVCRYRGNSTLQARRWFVAVWHLLRPIYLCRPVCLPRVWPDLHRPAAS